ncbi:MAG: DUF370 domain-containing protein [Lachnospiraceae bacterium]|nr:DUF370 domain-containing protein [Lachnospiraceae bacterium]
MNDFIHVGFGNIVNRNKVIAIVSPEGAPIRRMVSNSRDNGSSIDATHGRKTRSVLFMEGGQLVLSALSPETLLRRSGIEIDGYGMNDPEDDV